MKSTETMLEWTAAYAVGVPQIDQEHQRLFAFANQMHRAMIEGQGKRMLEDLLAGLVDYTCYHFANEERLMERIRYPDYPEHRRQHDELRAGVRAMQARSASGEVTMTIEAMRFLMQWIKRHTTTSDRRIGEYTKATLP
jgi:hemerythrin